MLNTTSGKDGPELSRGSDGLQLLASDMLVRKVFTLIEHKEFDSSLPWIAGKLDESLEAINDALKALETIGAITNNNGTITQTVETLSFAKNLKERSLEEKQRDHSTIAQQVLNDLKPITDAFTNNGTTATDHSTLSKFKDRIREAMILFEKESKSSGRDLLVCYSVTATDVLKSNKGGLQ